MFLTIDSGLLYTIYIVVGLAVGVGTLIGYVKRPWTGKAKEHRKQKHILKLFMNGDPGVAGLIATIVPGPERVADAETAIKEHTELLKSQGQIIQEQGKLLQKVQDGITNLTSEVIQIKSMWTANGGNTNSPADVQMRQAKKSGVWLDEANLNNTTHE